MEINPSRLERTYLQKDMPTPFFAWGYHLIYKCVVYTACDPKITIPFFLLCDSVSLRQ
jgi:hypothetical protein